MTIRTHRDVPLQFLQAKPGASLAVCQNLAQAAGDGKVESLVGAIAPDADQVVAAVPDPALRLGGDAVTRVWRT